MVQHNEIKQFFALKIISKLASIDPMNEVKIAGILGESPYIVKTYGFSQNEANFYIIMEYVTGAKDLIEFVLNDLKFFNQIHLFFGRWHLES